MNIDPSAISIVALIVAICSFVISSYRASIDRRLQWEQLRGDIQIRLTSRSVELLTMIWELRSSNEEENISAMEKLLGLAEILVDMRRRLRHLEIPFFFPRAVLVAKLAPLKSDLDETDLIFEILRIAVRERNVSRITKAADGLVRRLGGNGPDSG